MKTSIKKFISTMMLLVLFLPLIPLTIANAKELNSNEALVTKYLEAIKNSDVDTVVSLSNDKRVDSDVYSQSQNFVELIGDTNNTIKTYNIINSYDDIVLVNIAYVNGRVEEVPIKVSNINGENKIIIEENLSEYENHKVINEGNVVVFPQLRATKIYTWDITGLNGTIYSKASFSMSSGSHFLNFRQWSPTPLQTLVLSYSIVRKSIFGDTTYAMLSQEGHFEDYGKNVDFYMPSSQSGVYLKVSADKGNSARSWGNIYRY